MSTPITTLDLTGATTNQTGTVSWNLQAVGASWQEISSGAIPYLELVNMSACMLQITIAQSTVVMPLPPGSWHIFPLDPQSTSYSYKVLNAQQNATQNLVYGYYYTAREGAPTTGQIVNQSQALAAPSAQANLVLGVAPGDASPKNLTLNAGGAGPGPYNYMVQSLTISYTSGLGGAIGVGMLIVVQFLGPALGYIVHCQENSTGPIFLPLNLSLTSAGPPISMQVISQSGAVFSRTAHYSVIGYSS